MSYQLITFFSYWFLREEKEFYFSEDINQDLFSFLYQRVCIQIIGKIKYRERSAYQGGGDNSDDQQIDLLSSQAKGSGHH